jgi:HAD superfamily hydrolase (TIGR01549 family)
MIDKKKIKAVIFDMDGVLIDSEDIWYEAKNAVFKEETGKDLSREYNSTLMGRSYIAIWEKIAKDFKLKGNPKTYVERVLANMKRVRKKQGIPLVDGAMELLERCKTKGLPAALASGGGQEDVDYILDNLNLRKYFDYIISSDFVVNPKPAPDIFLNAAEGLSTPCENCVVIEDSISGIKAAKAAGMQCIAYRSKKKLIQDCGECDELVTSLSYVDL